MKPFNERCFLFIFLFCLLLISGCFLQSLILSIGAGWLEQEKKDLVAAKAAYMSENCPTPSMSGDQAALMVRDNERFKLTVCA